MDDTAHRIAANAATVEDEQWMTGRDGAGGPISVLVVEDEETVSEFLQMGLTYEGYAVEIVHDGRDALAAFERARPQIVLLDLMLPGIDGLTLCRMIRARSDVPIIMLTARGAVEDRVEGLNSGADDYLPKPFKFAELMARMSAVLRRHQVTTMNVLTVGNLTLDRSTRDVTHDDKPLTLTPREFDLLEYFMQNPRQVLTREAILNRVWGYDQSVETNVVDVYVRYLRAKLADDRHERIQTVRGVGYLLRP
jgi:DNA-binding response OmpR family regulator